MADAYRQILDELRAHLDGLGTTGANVFEDPTHAIEAGTIPALAIEPDEDAASPVGEDINGLHIEAHRFRVRLTVLADQIADRDAGVLDVKLGVAKAIGETRRRFVSTQFGKARAGQESGAKSYYAAAVVYEIQYETRPSTPDTIL